MPDLDTLPKTVPPHTKCLIIIEKGKRKRKKENVDSDLKEQKDFDRMLKMETIPAYQERSLFII